jgi:hypothetical protein
MLKFFKLNKLIQEQRAIIVEQANEILRLKDQVARIDEMRRLQRRFGDGRPLV